MLLRRTLIAALTMMLALPLTAAQAAPPASTANQIGASKVAYGLEFTWRIDIAAGATFTVEYRGCGGQLAGRFSQTSNERNPGTLPIYANTHKLGSDWTRTLTISEPGRETLVEEAVNADPNLFFDCSGAERSLVARWPRSYNEPADLAAGARLEVSRGDLSDFGHYREAAFSYAWKVGGVVVSRQLSLKIDEKWVGKKLSFVSAVRSSTTAQSKTIEFGTVLKTHRVKRANGGNANYLWVESQASKLLGAPGTQVYLQVADCRRRRTGPDWKNAVRQTVTGRGAFNFGARGPQADRTYKTRQFKTGVDPRDTVARFLIPRGNGFAEFTLYRGGCLHTSG